MSGCISDIILLTRASILEAASPSVICPPHAHVISTSTPYADKNLMKGVERSFFANHVVECEAIRFPERTSDVTVTVEVPVTVEATVAFETNKKTIAQKDPPTWRSELHKEP